MKIIISPEYKDNIALGPFVENLPNLFEKEGTTLYADRNTIKSFTIDGSDPLPNQIIVKRYKRPNIAQRIIYSFFRSTKAKRSFYNAKKLRDYGIETPHEMAYIEQWRNGLFADGYFISEYDGAPPIREKLIEQEDFDRIMAADFADFAVQLHEAGILDHDLNSTNVLYHSVDDHYRFSLIDINRMVFLPERTPISRKDCLDNLTRFTSRMDLFEYVIGCYAKKRNWKVEATLQEGIAIKKKHDKQRKQRKAFLQIFKRRRPIK